MLVSAWRVVSAVAMLPVGGRALIFFFSCCGFVWRHFFWPNGPCFRIFFYFLWSGYVVFKKYCYFIDPKKSPGNCYNCPDPEADMYNPPPHYFPNRWTVLAKQARYRKTSSAPTSASTRPGSATISALRTIHGSHP